MFALVIAQTSPAFPSGLLVPAWAIGSVLIIYYAVATWDRIRQKPPSYEVFATKKELDTISQRWREEFKALDERREEDQKESRALIGSNCNDLERVILGKIADNKENTSAQFGELRGELHAVRGTMQTLSNEMMRAIGKLEGGTKQRAH